MTTQRNIANSTTHNAGLSSPSPSEAHQQAGGRSRIADRLALANNGYTFAFALTLAERAEADALAAEGLCVRALFPASNGLRVPTYFTLRAAAIYLRHTAGDVQ